VTRDDVLDAPLPIEPATHLDLDMRMRAALSNALVHFRRPFEPAAVRWKVQSAGSGYGLVVAYIDARLVVERLNAVAGGWWDDEYRVHAQGVEECALTVFGATRRDVGTAGGFEAAKSMRSDSLKRAGTHFGIGVSIYAMKSVLLEAAAGKDPAGDKLLTHNKRSMRGNKEVWSARMSPAAERWLAETYGRWLEAKGEKLFGPALGHGDEEGAQGIEGEEGAAAPVDVDEGPGPALEDELAAGLRERIEAAYGAIRKINGAAIPPGQHKARVKAAEGSHEALGEYAVELEGALAQMEEVRRG
jgi:hypothetical protein